MPARAVSALDSQTPAERVLTLCELADPGVPGLETHSPCCLKVHRALRLAGLDYQRRHGAHPGAFAKYNPAGQVPVLLVGDEPVADSTRILHRIQHLSNGALTRGLDARTAAEAWLWEELGDTSILGFVVAARWADEDNWPAVRTAYFAAMPAPLRLLLVGRIRSRVMASLHARDVWRGGKAACWERMQRMLDQLEARAPEDGWWMGGAAPSVADVGLFAHLHSLRTALTPWQAEQVAARSKLSAWLDRVQEATRPDSPRSQPRSALRGVPESHRAAARAS